MPRALDYAAADLSARQIEEWMLARERARKCSLWLRFAIGLPASFLAPAIAATIATSLSLMWGYHWNWWLIFAIASAVLLPLLCRRAAARETSLFDDAAGDLGWLAEDALEASSYGEWEMNRALLAWVACTELIFWGPLIVVTAYRMWRLDKSAALACRVRAVQVVRELWAADGGIAVEKLLSEGEGRAAIAGAIRYLLAYEWIDISERKDRVWLLSEVRQRLDEQCMSARPTAR